MKYLILFVLSFATSGAFAVDKTEIIFHRKNHLGFEKTDNILFDGKNSWINALSLTNVPAPKVKQMTDKIRAFKAPPKNSCSAGEFELTITTKGKTSKQQGCMGGEAYAELVVTVEDLKNLARGK
ncbi:hypothetical protein D3C72_1812400 [compost metagenome]